jgi:hypothetical protein
MSPEPNVTWLTLMSIFSAARPYQNPGFREGHVSATRWQGRIRGVGARGSTNSACQRGSENPSASSPARLIRPSWGASTRIFVLVDARRRGKADGAQEPIEGSVGAAIEAIEQCVLVWREASVAAGQVKAGGAQGSVDALALPELELENSSRRPFGASTIGRSSCRPVA